MWLMLPKGALSIVARGRLKEGEDRTLVVRARRREYLTEFRKMYCPELGPTLHLKNRDYQYRAYVRPDDMARATARVVLSIDYHNFKSATYSKERGLRSAKLRSGLHSAYERCWSALLDAGDGTSVYDWKSWKSNGSGSWTNGNGVKPTGIEACRRWAHWWPVGTKECKDCGEPNPNYPHKGPDNVFPPPAADEETKGKKVRKSKKGKQASAKALIETAPALTDAGDCPGSYVEPAWDTVELGTPDNGYQETGVCTVCGGRFQLDVAGYAMAAHYPAEEAVTA